MIFAVPNPSISAKFAHALEVAGIPAVITNSSDMMTYWTRSTRLAAAVLDLDFAWAMQTAAALHRDGIFVIALSDNETAQIRALRSGFIEALPCAISPQALVARIRALIENSDSEVIVLPEALGRLRIDALKRIASWDEKSLEMTSGEFDLLSYFADRAGTVLSKRQIKRDFQWEEDNTLQQAVWQLRRSLGPQGARHIVNRHGFGYGYIPSLPRPMDAPVLAELSDVG